MGNGLSNTFGICHEISYLARLRIVTVGIIDET